MCKPETQNLGSLFSPSKNTIKYGLNSITQKSINNWNSITKDIKIDLISHYKVKTLLTKNFI